ncbi:Oidioi.mRNA.OKI2018_I69.PAR.g12214.t1.cds [Oikopleura dioica]|uniref:Serine palmitoyltransferase 1 n=1 Tax=Oikopleura dioica TaxID=34765 RepID=A0ABN7RZ26_OIKDI|nr:Oidioi.mRNA.OKI2018_I69.PAR.g12214.t1.cds [Oikopleura dioica]
MERFFTLEALKTVPYYHLCIELILIYCIYWLYFSGPQRDRRRRPELTEAEKQKLIDEWEPEPLVPIVEEPQDRIVKQLPGSKIIVDGDECLDFGSFDFLGLNKDEAVVQSGMEGIKDYGVGSCGPRGFFGTFDAHINLEVELANFLGVDEAILYSYGFSTIASAIPAYAKKGDILFIDEQSNFAIQQGAKASRSTIRWYRHNDMDHLKELLDSQAAIEAKNPKKKAKVTRKILIAEGIYQNTGSIAQLKTMVEFKYKYQVRIFLDESNSFGVLGESGKGLTEHLNVDVLDIDLISAETERAIPSIGEHSNAFDLTGDEISPIKHLLLTHPNNNENLNAIRSLVQSAQAQGIALVSGEKLDQDRTCNNISIRLTVSAAFSEEELSSCVDVLSSLIKQLTVSKSSI